MVVGPPGPVGLSPAAGPTGGWCFPSRDPVGPPPSLAASGISPFTPFPSASRHSITSIAIASQAGDGRLPARPAPPSLRRRRRRRRRASHPPGTPPLPSPSVPAVWLSVLASQQLCRFLSFFVLISTTHPIDWLELCLAACCDT